MHEMSLIGDVIEVAQRYAKQNGASRVTRVDLRVGEMRDVVDELMQSCFDYLSKDTMVQGAQLHFERVPLKARCNACHVVFPVDLRDSHKKICPDCACEDVLLFSGWEFIIESIEVE